jgi:4-hydroxybenzoate polyprenyltransferase
MTPRTLLDLGRVSNLPTVWTNVLAGAVLSGGRLETGTLAVTALAASLFYVGGMFLNDAFDRDFDARERPERPIPSGRVQPGRVFTMGFALMAGGLLLVSIPLWRGAPGPGPIPWWPLAVGAVLGGFIVFYDAFHKGNPLSAVVMGLCRATVYGMAAVTVGELSRDVVLGAVVLLAYVVGLTGVARQENRASVTSLFPLALLAVPFVYAATHALNTGLVVIGLGFLAWVVYALSFLHPRRGPRIPRTVTGLIAGISLLDALLIAAYGSAGLAGLACLGLPLTLAGQRFVRGT